MAPVRGLAQAPRAGRWPSRVHVWFIGASVLILAGCAGPQSALAPSGLEAAWVAQLFWVMLIGAGLIWTLVIGFAIYVTRLNPQAHSEKAAGRLIVWGGVVFPVTVLGALLIYGLALMPALRAPGGGLRIEVSGEQWWWRVKYSPPGRAAPVTSANEIRLPVGQRSEIILTSPDVIHSFWIPSLAGKVDMIPGRINRIVLEPTETGVYRGQCAEYCGTAHALMAFSVVVMPRDKFAQWLEQEARPAATPRAPRIEKGRNLFLVTGCGACHTVRGTRARGVIGPDLTHVGSRRTIGAGTLVSNTKSIARFIAQTQRIKPGVRMPSFGMLPGKDIDAIAAYLESLE
ncbi:MAG: cytochrome c oxidase subunit II [Gammaproteobacteria bacterium]|nr:cytochrome c oxidase subunit II [Gammaproteobacteria bacterium]